MTNNCYILVGVPGSGKTNWITGKLWKGDYENSCIASTDDIIESVCLYHNLTYTEGFDLLIKFADKIFWRDIEDAITKNLDIVIDRTNLSYASRQKIINFIISKCNKNQKYLFHAIEFNTPEKNEWKRRLAERKNKVIPETILNMMVSLKEKNPINIQREGLTSHIKI